MTGESLTGGVTDSYDTGEGLGTRLDQNMDEVTHALLQYSISTLTTLCTSLVPRLLCGGGGKRAWYTLFAHAPGSLGNLHTTPLH